MIKEKAGKVNLCRYNHAFNAYLTHCRKGQEVNQTILTKYFKKLDEVAAIVNSFSVTEIPEADKINIVEQVIAQEIYK